MINLKISILTAFVLLGISCFAQAPSFELEQVTTEELTSNYYEHEDHWAVTLAEYGKSELSMPYGEDKGFYMFHTKYARFKVLDETAPISLQYILDLQKSGGYSDRLRSVKGYVHSWSGGKYSKTYFEPTAEVGESENEYNVVSRFELPVLEAGSIVEVVWVIESDFIIYVPSWQFQDELPVLDSRFMLSVPEWFRFSMHSTLSKFDGEDFSQTTRWLRIGDRENSSSYKQNIYRWEMRDLKAYNEEPYTPGGYACLAQVDFEIHSIQFPNSEKQSFTTSWQVLADFFWKRNGKSKRSICNKSVVDKFESIADETEKAQSIYTYVQKNYAWNSVNTIWPSKAKNDLCESRIGSSYDLNMQLLHLLEACGINAKPILISSHKNGPIRVETPSLLYFNKIIVRAEIGANTFFLDATDKVLRFGELSPSDYVDRALCMSKENPEWIDIPNQHCFKSRIKATIHITPENKLQVNWTGKHYGVADYEARELDLAGDSVLSATVWREFQTSPLKIIKMDIDTGSAQEFSTSSGNAVFNKVSIKDTCITISPIAFETAQINPFSAGERNCDIDLRYLKNIAISTEYAVPDGFEILSIPNSKRVVLLDNTFTYQVSDQGNKVILTTILKLNRTYFPASQYANVKKFFAEIEKLLKQEIVLKQL